MTILFNIHKQIYIYINDITILKELVKKINNLEVIQYIFEDESDAILIFQTVNDRGIPLSLLEKTKSFLMHMLYLSNEESYHSQINEINTTFSEIYRYIEKIKDTE